MSDKKTYKAPEICRVKLNPDQAILAVCSSGVTRRGTSGSTCRNKGAGTTSCKKRTTGGNSAANS